ncbi:hypothetical protein NPIL_477391 [Nephila pilipes]|uniref:Uncharacterized protein n=1 Tax=Nephila pilipes TaxID=299642 RepID=A0A8X6U667_NEPPI|nr:hypothetical protein NPIL_477391 [Nephila pilipes]
MAWSAIAYDCRSPLVCIVGSTTSQRYVDEVLHLATLPFLRGMPFTSRMTPDCTQSPSTLQGTECFLSHLSPRVSQQHVWDVNGHRLHCLSLPLSGDEL